MVLPHYAPDTAPTGVEATRLAEDLGARGHTIEVVTALPWYAEHDVDPAWRGRPVRRDRQVWGRLTRVWPFPTADKRNLAKRAAGFAGFCGLTAAVGAPGPRADVVLALTPPVPMAATGWLVARARRAPLVLDVKDIFPDVAVELGMITDPRLVRAAYALERWSYARSAAITVLGEDMRANLAAKVPDPGKLTIIPNPVDVAAIRPMPADNGYRAEFGLSGKTVVMYAGNVGMSQSLDLLVDAARAYADRPDVVFVVNGGGSTLETVRRSAAGLPNVVFVPFQPAGRLPEVLAAADVHLVPLRRGLARSSVPSKTYSILAAGRPVLASVDEGSTVAEIVEVSGAGLAVPPEDPAAFRAALGRLVDEPAIRARMGTAARAHVERTASATGVTDAYEQLFADVVRQWRQR